MIVFALLAQTLFGSGAVILAKIVLVLFIAWQIDRMIWHDPQSWAG